MNTFLQLPEPRRLLAFQQVDEAMGLQAVSVEKDFWVCWTLKELFTLPGICEHLTFKGGTSLSKAWKFIERFADLLRRIHLVEAWGRGIPLILDKAPDVHFSQIAGIFITEFPRPVALADDPEGTGQVTPWMLNVLSACSTHPRTSSEIQAIVGIRHRETFQRNYLDRLSSDQLLERTIPDKPNSRLQKYRLTEKGRRMIYEG